MCSRWFRIVNAHAQNHRLIRIVHTNVLWIQIFIIHFPCISMCECGLFSAKKNKPFVLTIAHSFTVEIVEMRENHWNETNRTAHLQQTKFISNLHLNSTHFLFTRAKNDVCGLCSVECSEFCINGYDYHRMVNWWVVLRIVISTVLRIIRLIWRRFQVNWNWYQHKMQ